MTLKQPGLDSDPPNGSGQERGATVFPFHVFCKENSCFSLLHADFAFFIIL